MAIFSENHTEISDEIQEDFDEINQTIDIISLVRNVDGAEKDISQLLSELRDANKANDKQKCIESIAMLRCFISDVESAFSNAMDSMEKLVVTIRDDC